MRFQQSLLIFVLLAAVKINAQSVSNYLLELENHTRWEAVDKKWKDQRNQWVANCKMENTPQKSAHLLLQLESNIKWEAVDANWSTRRNTWVTKCNHSGSNGEVAILLKELESNIKWEAVDEGWKARREGWINELNAIIQSTPEVASHSSSPTRESNYRSVTIGNQIWMAENLNVDKFKNGDPIHQVKTEAEWETAKANHEPAWWYGTNSVEDYGSTYGRLYNGYAVVDPRGLAPEGWHIPSDQEWQELLAYLVQSKTPVAALKSKDGWINGKNGTDVLGFSARPGGNSPQYICYTVGQLASWWSSTEDLDAFNYFWTLNENGFLVPNETFKYSGNSVRCIRNK